MADENLQKKIDEAKAAGYTDEEIQNYLNPTPPAPVPQPQKQSLVDMMHQYNPQGFGQPLTPEQTGTAQFGAGQAAKYLGEAGLGYGAYRGLKNVAQNFGNQSPPPPPPPSTGVDIGGQKVVDFARGMAPNGVPPSTSQLPMSPPSPPPQPPTAQNFIQRMSQLAQQYGPVVAEKIAPVARVGIPAALATYSPNLGPPVPQRGPYQGTEINPQTNRPWTAQELQQYR